MLYARVFLPTELAGDDNSIHLAEIAGIADALRAFDWNLWNASGNLGFPSAFYYQSLPQLTVALLHLATFSKVSLLFCYKLVVLLCLAGPPVTTAWALYRAERPLAEVFAAGVALLLVGGKSRWGIGADSLFSTGIFTQTFAFLFFGPALILGDRYLVTGRGLGLALALALATGLSHPFLGIVLGLYLVVRVVPLGELRAQLPRLVLFGVLLVAASAALWLPILVDYDSFGGFPARVRFEEGVPPAMFLPSILRFEIVTILGTKIPFVMARGELVDLSGLPILTLLGLGGLFVPAARRYAIWSVVSMALIMIGPSLGKTEDDLLPMIRLMAPLQWSHAVAAGITGLYATRSLAAWVTRRLQRARTTRARVPIIAGTLVLTLIVLGEVPTRVATLFRRPEVASHVRVAREELDTMLVHLAHQPRARVQVGTRLGTGNHFWAYLPYAYERFPAIASWGGAALQSSNNFVYLREDIDPAITAQLFDAPYVFMRPTFQNPIPPTAQVLASYQGYQLLKLPTAGFVSGVSILGTLPKHRFDRRKANLMWLRTNDARNGRHYEYAGSQLAHNAARLQLLRTEEMPSRYRLTMDVAQRGTAAVRITYHPRWRGTLDGQPLRLGRVSPDLIAFEVPEGTHTVELRFVRPSWHFLLYFASAMLLVGAFVWERRARRKNEATT